MKKLLVTTLSLLALSVLACDEASENLQEQDCPVCKDGNECPACEQCQKCETCPVCKDGDECPACEQCQKCETCPVCKDGDECPAYEKEECPACEQCQKCETCPVCKDGDECPACEKEECPACEQCQKCETCPECKECEACPACDKSELEEQVGELTSQLNSCNNKLKKLSNKAKNGSRLNVLVYKGKDGSESISNIFFDTVKNIQCYPVLLKQYGCSDKIYCMPNSFIYTAQSINNYKNYSYCPEMYDLAKYDNLVLLAFGDTVTEARNKRKQYCQEFCTAFENELKDFVEMTLEPMDANE